MVRHEVPTAVAIDRNQPRRAIDPGAGPVEEVRISAQTSQFFERAVDAHVIQLHQVGVLAAGAMVIGAVIAVDSEPELVIGIGYPMRAAIVPEAPFAPGDLPEIPLQCRSDGAGDFHVRSDFQCDA
jgi:hypothetical protein